MAVVAHEARLARPTPDGAGARAHLRRAAERGGAGSVNALRVPDFPESLDYLYDWFRAQSRGEAVHGPALLTHRDVLAWADLMQTAPEPHEVQALLDLDAAWRAAYHGTEAKDDPTALPPVRAWPTKKGDPDA